MWEMQKFLAVLLYMGICPLPSVDDYLLSDKDMRKKERGHYDYKSSDDVIAVKWHDNKCVTLLSNAIGVELEGAVKRYDKHHRGKIDTPCPSIVLAYNKHMGGIDLSDMLVSLYKTHEIPQVVPSSFWVYVRPVSGQWLASV